MQPNLLPSIRGAELNTNEARAGLWIEEIRGGRGWESFTLQVCYPINNTKSIHSLCPLFQDILNDSRDRVDLRVHGAVCHLDGAASRLPLHVRLRPPRLLQVREVRDVSSSVFTQTQRQKYSAPTCQLRVSLDVTGRWNVAD